MWLVQQRARFIEEGRMYAAHNEARRAKAAAATAAMAPPEPGVARRIDEISERSGAEPRPGPLIRRL
jgi:hypothetical protein